MSLEHKEVSEVFLVSIAHFLNGVHAGGADDGIAILGDNLTTDYRPKNSEYLTGGFLSRSKS